VLRGGVGGPLLSLISRLMLHKLSEILEIALRESCFQIAPVCAVCQAARKSVLIRPGMEAKRSSLVRPR